MKRLFIYFFFLFSSLYSFSQGDNPREFQYQVSDDDKRYSELNDFVVVPLKGLSSDKIYSLLLSNINKTYKNPKEVISATEENKYIKINGFADNLYCFSSLGTPTCTGGNYTLEFYFKDDRMKVEMVSLTNSASYDLKRIGINKKSGSPRGMFKDTASTIENYFNTLIKNLTSETVKTDW
jgi:hypothetical protein